MAADATRRGADLVIFPELALTGYPPEDLLFQPSYVRANERALNSLAASTAHSASVVVGYAQAGHDLHNSAAICADGLVRASYCKRELPNYLVFDERRYFAPGSEEIELFMLNQIRFGVMICEDIWSPRGPMTAMVDGGAEVIVVINASPFSKGRQQDRLAMLSTRAREHSCPIVYVNRVGAQDELIFDGGSTVVDAAGGIVCLAPRFAETCLIAEILLRPPYRQRRLGPDQGGPARPRPLRVVELSARPTAFEPGPEPPASVGESVAGQPPPWLALCSGKNPDETAEIYQALVEGTRAYVDGNHFSGALVGLSGGIDSALVATVAVDALGRDRVVGVSMPSCYTSSESVEDARELAANLGIELLLAPITEAHPALAGLVGGATGVEPTGLTDENLQSRLRGLILMALSNQSGRVVLTTGNKSELAVGYATLYGDTIGGFAVIKDIWKTEVFDLARWRNRWPGSNGSSSLIPERIILKPPTAELRPNQRDDQTLPPYDVLDPILEHYIEGEYGPDEIACLGFDAGLVRKALALVDAAEYKRRQYPPGVRVTARAFGRDRRMPLTRTYPTTEVFATNGES
jgi:NAD+ synthase (glutamine-hydrolysing)